MRPITLICALAAILQLVCGTALASGGWTWPVRGPVLTAYRNGADPYAAGQHRGVDIGAPVGARVVAASAGTVTFVGVVGSSGLTVSQRTADGRFDLSYLHLSSASVSRGDSVEAGAALGAVGTSGSRSAEDPHLHFGVREAGQRSAYRDPFDFLAPLPGDAPEPRPVPVPVAHTAAAEPAVVPAAAASGSLPASAGAPAPVSALGPSAALLPGPPALAPTGGLPRAHGRPAAGASAPAPGLPAALPSLLAAPGHRGSDARPRQVTTAVPAGPRLAATRGPTSPAHSAAPRLPHSSRRPSAATHARGGIDIGWLVACLGLVAAATALGHPDQARKAVARGRAGFRALVARQ